MADSSKQISAAVKRVQGEVPAFVKLRLVFGLELTAGGLMGPSKSDHFTVALPGPTVSAGEPENARISLSIPKTMFELLAAEGQLVDWKDAFYYGHLKVSGDERVKRLLGKAIGAS